MVQNTIPVPTVIKSTKETTFCRYKKTYHTVCTFSAYIVSLPTKQVFYLVYGVKGNTKVLMNHYRALLEEVSIVLQPPNQFFDQPNHLLKRQQRVVDVIDMMDNVYILKCNCTSTNFEGIFAELLAIC